MFKAPDTTNTEEHFSDKHQDDEEDHDGLEDFPFGEDANQQGTTMEHKPQTSTAKNHGGGDSHATKQTVTFEFDLSADGGGRTSLSNSRKGIQGLESSNRASMAQSIKNVTDMNDEEKNSLSACWKSKMNRFRFFIMFLPSLFSVWYAAAILFPPGARKSASLLLWDDGELDTVKVEFCPKTSICADDDGELDTVEVKFCPKTSICANGVLEIVMISLSRLTAFASYTFMGVTFLSKMHFLIRFLSSTYLLKLIPFESLHHVHTFSANMYGSLIFIHVVTHYIRYILRSDVDQLKTKVHVSGLCGALAMVLLIVSMSSFMKKWKDGVGKFEKRFSLHWIGIFVFCVSMFIHTYRTRVITLVFL